MQHTTSHEAHLPDELLSERLDDRLGAAERQRVDQHLAACAACAAHYDGLRATRSAIATLRVVTLPRDFRLDVAMLHASAPRRLIPAHNVGLARWLSAAALICGLIFLAVGLVTFTLSNDMTDQIAASNAPAPVSQVSTSCVNHVHCPSVSGGADTGATPTNTAIYGSDGKTSAAGTASTPSGGASQQAEYGPVNAGHNSTPSLLVISFGILAALAGIIGLRRWRRPYPSPPAPR